MVQEEFLFGFSRSITQNQFGFQFIQEKIHKGKVNVRVSRRFRKNFSLVWAVVSLRINFVFSSFGCKFHLQRRVSLHVASHLNSFQQYEEDKSCFCYRLIFHAEVNFTISLFLFLGKECSDLLELEMIHRTRWNALQFIWKKKWNRKKLFKNSKIFLKINKRSISHKLFYIFSAVS